MDRLSSAGICSVGDKIVGMKNWKFYLVGLLLGLVIVMVPEIPGDQARMVVCDVGQGDAIVIVKGEIQVVIDGGPSSEKILSCLEEQIPFYDRVIELIVLTNTDFDHINGLSTVLDRYSVMHFVTSDGVHKSEALDKLVSKLSENEVVVSGVERGDSILVKGKNDEVKLTFEVLWPPDIIEENVAIFSDQMDKVKREQILGASAKRGDLNERSVVLLLLEDKSKILLMGDAGIQAEKELIKMGNLPDVDILKVGHHGSKYASTLDFLQLVKPELAMISVGAKNNYGHPTNETLGRLSKIGAIVRRTDLEGRIELEL